MNKNYRKSLLAKAITVGVFVLVTVSVAVVNKFNSPELPSDANGGYVAKTSQERTAELVEQEESRLKNEVETDPNMTEAPSEGVQRRVYENLEQPAPIIGSREVFVFKHQYIASFNLETNCPNYVCWVLTKDRVEGDVKRADEFYGDPVFPEDTRVETTDYVRSGYDRGHMCPAGDNKNSEVAMKESFSMVNICPQAPNLNKGEWNSLENQCRKWAKEYGTLYICCGPIFDSKNPKKIGKRKNVKVSVPDRFFKVVLTLDGEPKAIGFIYPNDDTSGELRSYAVSVDQVEKITGFDFYPNLDDEEEAEIESKCKPAAWGI